jgi:hypothetical protein
MWRIFCKDNIGKRQPRRIAARKTRHKKQVEGIFHTIIYNVQNSVAEKVLKEITSTNM